MPLALFAKYAIASSVSRKSSLWLAKMDPNIAENWRQHSQAPHFHFF